MSKKVLWYKSAAESFNEAIPVGNGRIGGMIYGKPYNEVIGLNEDSIWSGGKRYRVNPEAAGALPEIRRLILEDKPDEAEQLAFRKMQGISTDCRRYMPLVDLCINMELSGVAKEYKRGLDLETAVSFVEFKTNGVRYRREIFVSAPDNVMVVHFESCGADLSLTAFFRNKDDFYDNNRPVKDNVILFTGGYGGYNGINYAAALSAGTKDGSISTEGGKLYIKDTRDVYFVISARSSFYSDTDFEDTAVTDIDNALTMKYDELRFRHESDYGSYFNRVKFTLCDNCGEGEQMPTDERIMRMRGNELDDKECDSHIHDNGLMTLYFDFARYLMISASREGTLPMNYQGIWTGKNALKTGGRYELNINMQMDHWIAQSCGLSECSEPMFSLLERIRDNGHITAREMYGCDGFVCHNATDLWGDTAPCGSDDPKAFWCMGGAWLCLYIYEKYEYTLDVDFLRDKYPIMRDAALFFSEYLREDEKGQLIVIPSISPNNSYRLDNGRRATFCKSASIDSQIIGLLFDNVIKAAEILDTDKEFAQKLTSMKEKLPVPQVGKFGQIKEWIEDYNETDTGHKFVSQLFALHPAAIITPEKTPRLADAARATLIRRLIHGSGHAGISRAWVANMWARLKDSEMVYENLQKLIAYSINPNMFDGRPEMCIDGNFGGASAMVEALMQSSAPGEITLLPALPSEWQEGAVKGLRAKGGFSVSIRWKGRQLDAAEIRSDCGGRVKVRVGTVVSVSCDGVNVNSTAEDGCVIFDTRKGKVYTIK